MNPHNKDEFTAAWEALDKPEEIREAFERDDNPEPRPAKYKYRLTSGQLERIDDGEDQEKA